jgi:hypothetical protein
MRRIANGFILSSFSRLNLIRRGKQEVPLPVRIVMGQ